MRWLTVRREVTRQFLTQRPDLFTQFATGTFKAVQAQLKFINALTEFIHGPFVECLLRLQFIDAIFVIHVGFRIPGVCHPWEHKTHMWPLKRIHGIGDHICRTDPETDLPVTSSFRWPRTTTGQGSQRRA